MGMLPEKRWRRRERPKTKGTKLKAGERKLEKLGNGLNI